MPGSRAAEPTYTPRAKSAAGDPGPAPATETSGGDGERWSALIDRVSREKASLRAFLEEAAFLGLQGDVLCIEFGAANRIEMEQLEKGEQRALVERTAEAIWGRPLKLEIRLRKRKEEPVEAKEEQNPSSVMENSLIQKALDLFDGNVEGIERR